MITLRKSHLRKSYLVDLSEVGLPESISHQEVPPQLFTALNETVLAISWRKNPKLLRVYWAPENNVLLLQRGGIGQGIFDSPVSVDNVNSWQECGKCQSLMQTLRLFSQHCDASH